MKTIDERILHRAGKPGGASRHQLTSHLFDAVRRPEARRRLDELLASGQVLRFTRPAISGRGNPSQQFFTDREDGERWANAKNPARRKPARLQLERQQPAKASNFATLTDPSNRRNRKHLASLPPKSAPQDVVIPAGLKVRVIPGMPAFDPRYQVDPSTRVVGGFAAMGPGRYLEDSRP